jgi:hypothetical protein
LKRNLHFLLTAGKLSNLHRNSAGLTMNLTDRICPK